ncbi:MAG: YceK/YidQ family lipoprotein [Desulfobacteraceae bacterium]
MKSFLSKARIVALILVIVFLNGCASVIATFCTEDPDRLENKIYSGVRIDATIIEKGGECGGGARFICYIDVPFSLVLDTIFLPYTTAYYFDQSNPSKYLKNHPGSFPKLQPMLWW